MFPYFTVYPCGLFCYLIFTVLCLCLQQCKSAIMIHINTSTPSWASPPRSTPLVRHRAPDWASCHCPPHRQLLCWTHTEHSRRERGASLWASQVDRAALRWCQVAGPTLTGGRELSVMSWAHRDSTEKLPPHQQCFCRLCICWGASDSYHTRHPNLRI